MRAPQPLDVRPLFRLDRGALLELLESLPADAWDAPTACGGWSVRDVASHIWGGDLANVSRRRDGHRGVGPEPDEPLGRFIGRFNESWVEACRRISPRALIDALRGSGEPLFRYFDGVDIAALGDPVSWAGPHPAPVWVDVAREYTERWVHQQHIRDAVAAPGQMEPRLLAPVLATFAHAFPVALAPATAVSGTAVSVTIEGSAGATWIVVRDSDGWRLHEAEAGDDISGTATAVTMSGDLAWRLLTLGTSAAEAEPLVRIYGDRALGRRVLDAVAIIA